MAGVAGAVIGAAASIFGAKSSSDASKQAAQSQKEAAELQTRVARELHDHWKAYYLPCDVAQVNEVCAEPVYEPRYEVVAGRTRFEILRSFARARDQARRCADTYCIGSNAQTCNFLTGIEATALADAVNFGYRWEENYALQRNQIRIENRYRVLGLGRNLLSQSSAASQLAATIQQSIGAQAGRAANGYLQAAGYFLSERGQNAINSIFGRIGDAVQTNRVMQNSAGLPTEPEYGTTFTPEAPGANPGSASGGIADSPATTDASTGVVSPVGAGFGSSTEFDTGGF